MKKLRLPNVTVLGIDCVNIQRLQSAMDVSEKDIDFGASVLLTSLPCDDSRAVQIPHIGSIEEFSRFCIEELHTYVTTDYVLLIQYDGFVLDAGKWTGDFLDYDYIGGPIDTSAWKDRGPDEPRLIMGNGGFCLRSKRLLELGARLSREGVMERVHPEDIALCVWYRELLEKEGIRFAPMDLATRFSVQYDYGTGYEKPFGFHGSYGKNLEIVAREHPEFPLLFFMARIRRGRVLRMKDVFGPVATNGYYFGPLAEGSADAYDGIAAFISIPDERFLAVTKNRLSYYEAIGYGPEIIHVYEPSVTDPREGIHSVVLYKTKVGLLKMELFLCPESSSFFMEKGKALFGEKELPAGILPPDVRRTDPSDRQRVNFLITVAFDAIGNVARKNPDAVDSLVREYGELARDRHELRPLPSQQASFATIETAIGCLKGIATDEQRRALDEIGAFIRQVETYLARLGR